MNFKTTLALFVLVGAAAALGALALFAPIPFAWQRAEPTPDRGTHAALEKLRADDLTRIEIHKGEQTTTLVRERGVWSLPGRWPTREPEVKQLIALLGGLRSRFDPIPITDDTDLSKYGLKKPALTVRLETDQARSVVRQSAL